MNSEHPSSVLSAQQVAHLTNSLAALVRHFAAIAPQIVESINKLASDTEKIKPEMADRLQEAVADIRQVLRDNPLPDHWYQPRVTSRIGGMELAEEITGKARSTLYNLIAAGKLPVRKFSGKLYFDEQELLTFINQSRRTKFEEGASQVLDQFSGVVGAVKSNSPFDKAFRAFTGAVGSAITNAEVATVATALKGLPCLVCITDTPESTLTNGADLKEYMLHAEQTQKDFRGV